MTDFRTKNWQLPELLRAGGVALKTSVPDLPIEQVTDDSRAVRKNSLFVAVKGAKADGHRFVSQAVEKGASAVLIEREAPVPPPAVSLRVPSTQALLGPLVSAFYREPSRRLSVIGVTGTNGKTTVAWLAHHLLESAGVPSGLIGTVCCRVGGAERPSTNTTPGAVALQTMFSEMTDAGLKACVTEVSSHALDQRRTDGTLWACGVFTNLSPEHLDYHGTMESYLKAKIKLFEALPPEAAAVINRDDPAWERVSKGSKARLCTFSIRKKADLYASRILCSLEGTECEVVTSERVFPFRWNLVGRHNIQNLLAALGAVMSLGIPAEKALQAAAGFKGVPGRLERVDSGNSFPVFVDYAHTDDALKCVLEHLKSVTSRKILVVFGCGGDRDRTKRSRMGRVAGQLADRVIVTSDNPRSEEPAAIAAEIQSGLKGSPVQWETILDRREAIRAAVESSGPDWLVLVAGKGHETGQIVGSKVVPFDDREMAREFLSKSVPAGVKHA